MEEKIDLEWLLRVRVVVARCGEMDAMKWWNTNGQLGPLGAKVIQRGFPRTHYFAQARSVFAVAASRCEQVFDPPNSVTLWRLPEDVEEAFDARWESWLDDADAWKPFFASVERLKDFEIVSALKALSLVDDADVQAIGKLKADVGGKGVRVAATFELGRAAMCLLALGFSKSTKSDLVVPYARLPGAA